MVDMIKFYKLLSIPTEINEPSLKMLRLFTRLSPSRLMVMTNGLGWEPW